MGRLNEKARKAPSKKDVYNFYKDMILDRIIKARGDGYELSLDSAEITSKELRDACDSITSKDLLDKMNCDPIDIEMICGTCSKMMADCEGAIRRDFEYHLDYRVSSGSRRHHTPVPESSREYTPVDRHIPPPLMDSPRPSLGSHGPPMSVALDARGGNLMPRYDSSVSRPVRATPVFGRRETCTTEEHREKYRRIAEEIRMKKEAASQVKEVSAGPGASPPGMVHTFPRLVPNEVPIVAASVMEVPKEREKQVTPPVRSIAPPSLPVKEDPVDPPARPRRAVRIPPRAQRYTPASARIHTIEEIVAAAPTETLPKKDAVHSPEDSGEYVQPVSSNYNREYVHDDSGKHSAAPEAKKVKQKGLLGSILGYVRSLYQGKKPEPEATPKLEEVAYDSLDIVLDDKDLIPGTPLPAALPRWEEGENYLSTIESPHPAPHEAVTARADPPWLDVMVPASARPDTAPLAVTPVPVRDTRQPLPVAPRLPVAYVPQPVAPAIFSLPTAPPVAAPPLPVLPFVSVAPPPVASVPVASPVPVIAPPVEVSTPAPVAAVVSVDPSPAVSRAVPPPLPAEIFEDVVVEEPKGILYSLKEYASKRKERRQKKVDDRLASMAMELDREGHRVPLPDSIVKNRGGKVAAGVAAVALLGAVTVGSVSYVSSQKKDEKPAPVLVAQRPAEQPIRPIEVPPVPPASPAPVSPVQSPPKPCSELELRLNSGINSVRFNTRGAKPKMKQVVRYAAQSGSPIRVYGFASIDGLNGNMKNDDEEFNKRLSAGRAAYAVRQLKQAAKEIDVEDKKAGKEETVSDKLKIISDTNYGETVAFGKWKYNLAPNRTVLITTREIADPDKDKEIAKALAQNPAGKVCENLCTIVAGKGRSTPPIPGDAKPAPAKQGAVSAQQKSLYAVLQSTVPPGAAEERVPEGIVGIVLPKSEPPKVVVDRNYVRQLSGAKVETIPMPVLSAGAKHVEEYVSYEFAKGKKPVIASGEVQKDTYRPVPPRNAEKPKVYSGSADTQAALRDIFASVDNFQPVTRARARAVHVAGGNTDIADALEGLHSMSPMVSESQSAVRELLSDAGRFQPVSKDHARAIHVAGGNNEVAEALEGLYSLRRAA